MSGAAVTDFPSELVNTTKDFQTGLTNVERVLKPLLASPLSQIQVDPYHLSSSLKLV